MSEGTIARPLVAAVAEVAIAHGAPREVMAALVGAEERLPIDQLYDIWEAALHQTHEPSLPTRVGQAARFDRYGAIGMVLYVSATAEAGMRRLARYHDLLTDSGHWQMRREGDRFAAVWRRQTEARLGARAANEQVLASFATVARQLTAVFAPLELRLTHAPPDDSLARHVGAPVTLADENAIVMPAAWLGQRGSGSDPHLEKFLLAQIEGAIGASPVAESATHRIAAILVERIADGVPPIGEVAESLGLAERTLRRRCSDEGTSYEQLVVSVQRERAVALLARDHAIQEIALAVGFADPSAFTRAFRRWTGATPTEWRKRPR